MTQKQSAASFLLLPTLIAAACGGNDSPPQDRGYDQPTSASSSDPTPASASGADNQTPPAAGDEPSAGGDTARACIEQQCSTALAACGSDCFSLNTCITPCGEDDACWDRCFASHSDAAADALGALYECISNECADPAGGGGSSSSTGGSSNGGTPSNRPAEISIYASCWSVAVEALYIAPCSEASYGENLLDVSIGGGEGVRTSLTPGCYDIWAIHENGQEVGNSVTLRAGQSVTVGTCGGSDYDVPLVEGFSSTVKGTLADTQVRVEVLNHCSYHFCKVMRSPCGQNQWSRVSLGDRLSIPSDRATLFEHLPDGCQDYKFVPCYDELYAGFTWSGTFANRQTYTVELCAN